MTPFIQQMIFVRDQIAGLAGEFGNPNISSLIIRKRIGTSVSYLEIAPNPVIQEDFPSRESIENLSSIEGLKRIFNVSGVSRKYQEEQLRGIGVDYLIGARLKLGTPVGGRTCSLVSMDKKTLTWELQLVERIAEQNYYL